MTRRIFPAVLVCGALTFLAAVGCTPKGTTGPSGKGEEVLAIEIDEIYLIPGGPEKQVKVTKGKAEKAEAPADSGVKTKVEGDKLTLSAGKEAKEGTHKVTVKGKAKEVDLKVHVKKAAPKKDD
jgi:hypothetical protein